MDEITGSVDDVTTISGGSEGMKVAEGTAKINAIGVTITVETTIDLSAATKKNLRFIKPDGTVQTVIGTVDNTYNLKYTTTADDDGEGNTLLSQAGQWRVTPDITVTSYSGYLGTLYFTILGADS